MIKDNNEEGRRLSKWEGQERKPERGVKAHREIGEGRQEIVEAIMTKINLIEWKHWKQK